MNIDKLEVGMIVKNYRAMCELLGEEIKNGGKSKGYQFEKWKNYFNFHKEGNKFVIDEILNTNVVITDNRSTLPYKEEAKMFILSFILNNVENAICKNGELHTVYISNLAFREAFDLYNGNNMQLAFSNPVEFSKAIDCDVSTLKRVISDYKKKDKHLIESSLKFLSGRHLITWIPTKLVLDEEGYNKPNSLGGYSNWRVITIDENIKLNSIKRRLLNEYGVSNEWVLAQQKRIGKFYADLKSIAASELGIYDFTSTNIIGFDVKAIDDYLTLFGGKDKIDEIRAEISSRVVEYRLQYADEHMEGDKLLDTKKIHSNLTRNASDIDIEDILKEEVELLKLLQEL